MKLPHDTHASSDRDRERNEISVQRVDLASGGTIEVHVHAAPQPGPPLLKFPFGLEHEAARRLIRAGHLRVARIGRSDYARTADVAALVDKLAELVPSRPKPVKVRAESPSDALANIAQAERRRGAR